MSHMHFVNVLLAKKQPPNHSHKKMGELPEIRLLTDNTYVPFEKIGMDLSGNLQCYHNDKKIKNVTSFYTHAYRQGLLAFN